jgi:zinc ABC transporter, periplasmic zinc-binding protein
MDSKNADYYKQNYEKYKTELTELTEYVKGRINEIPEKSRVLVTAHDAFGYFGKQFGLEVKAIQGVSTDSETGTKNISDLANFIVERDIKAIFVESSVPKKSIEALQEAVKAKGKEVKIGGELYSDSLGDKEHNTESYIKTVKANADTIANALK